MDLERIKVLYYIDDKLLTYLVLEGRDQVKWPFLVLMEV